ncbi:MAG: DsrE family protein [bacterium]
MTDSHANDSIAVLFTRDGMGQAEPALSHKLASTYLSLLDLDGKPPASICFYGEGVRLVVQDSPVLEELQALAAKGVRLVACGTCLNHYQLDGQVKVGEVGSMKDIIAIQWASSKVISV